MIDGDLVQFMRRTEEEKSFRLMSDQWQQHWMTSGKSSIQYCSLDKEGGGVLYICTHKHPMTVLVPLSFPVRVHLTSGQHRKHVWSLLSAQGHGNSSTPPRRLCFYLCLFVCKQDYTKTTDRFSRKLLEKMEINEVEIFRYKP